MCQSTDKIIFCTCEKTETPKITHNKKNRKFNKSFDKNKYINEHLVWSLYQLDKIDKFVEGGAIIEGMINLPSTKMTNEITSQTILTALNQQQPFDFNYIPQEGDMIKIHYETKHKKYQKLKETDYLSFIYKHHKWIAETYSFESITEIKNGKIKLESLE